MVARGMASVAIMILGLYSIGDILTVSAHNSAIAVVGVVLGQPNRRRVESGGCPSARRGRAPHGDSTARPWIQTAEGTMFLSAGKTDLNLGTTGQPAVTTTNRAWKKAPDGTGSRSDPVTS